MIYSQLAVVAFCATCRVCRCPGESAGTAHWHAQSNHMTTPVPLHGIAAALKAGWEHNAQCAPGRCGMARRCWAVRTNAQPAGISIVSQHSPVAVLSYNMVHSSGTCMAMLEGSSQGDAQCAPGRCGVVRRCWAVRTNAQPAGISIACHDSSI